MSTLSRPLTMTVILVSFGPISFWHLSQYSLIKRDSSVHFLRLILIYHVTIDLDGRMNADELVPMVRYWSRNYHAIVLCTHLLLVYAYNHALDHLVVHILLAHVPGRRGNVSFWVPLKNHSIALKCRLQIEVMHPSERIGTTASLPSRLFSTSSFPKLKFSAILS